MEREAKAKGIASSYLGEKFVHFLATPAVLSRSIWKKPVEFNLFFQIDRGKTAGAARN